MAHDRPAGGSEAQGGARFLPAPVGAFGSADARADLGRESRVVHHARQENSHFVEACRLDRTVRADRTADQVERERRAQRDDTHRIARGEAEQAQGTVSSGVVGVATDHEFDERRIGHRCLRGAVALDDRGHHDRQPLQRQFIERPRRSAALQPDRADVLVVEDDRGGR
ncbi:hypothetical protein [Mycobacterium neumannii]|uniref:hypothetical protein n=1 Tax=Mycobacterium neumannii TaxID=2048551 RepID=UPI003AB2EB2E